MGQLPDSDGDNAPFGFRQVPVAEKAGLVRDVFDSVANDYDLMNDLMSGGQHRLWKSSFIDSLRPRAEEAILDVAGGTADIAERIYLARGAGGPLFVSDINEEMLREGKTRMGNRQQDQHFTWLLTDGECLPIKDASLNAITVAFGLRNMTRPDRALAEAHRVLKPGGRWLCLEFTPRALPLLDKIYERYAFGLIPALGAKFAGDQEAYQYLVESIRAFMPPERLRALALEQGFGRVGWRSMAGGVVAIHKAWKI